MNTRQKIVIWDDENYQSRQEAEQDGATSVIDIPRGLSPANMHHYMQAVKSSLRAAGVRICNYDQKLKYELVTETNYNVAVEVLEWNTYQFDVWAETPKQAQQIAVTENTNLHYNDVSYGTDGYKENEPTDARLAEAEL